MHSIYRRSFRSPLVSTGLIDDTNSTYIYSAQLDSTKKGMFKAAFRRL
jgi:hypothetical protein